MLCMAGTAFPLFVLRLSLRLHNTNNSKSAPKPGVITQSHKGSLVETIEIKDVVPMLSALIAGLATLAGVLIANIYNLKTSKANAEIAKQQQHINKRLEKLEDLYLLFEQWQTKLTNVYLIHLRVYVGKLEHNQALDLINESYGEFDNVFQRMQMLVNIYFSEVRPEYNQVMDVRSQLASYLGAPEETKLDAKSFVKGQATFGVVCNNFKETLCKLQRAL